MEAHFYDKEVVEPTLNLETQKLEDVIVSKVFFKLVKASIADHPSVAKPFEFDNIATEEHKKSYPSQWKEYQKSKEVVVDELAVVEPAPLTLSEDSVVVDEVNSIDPA